MLADNSAGILINPCKAPRLALPKVPISSPTGASSPGWYSGLVKNFLCASMRLLCCISSSFSFNCLATLSGSSPYNLTMLPSDNLLRVTGKTETYHFDFLPNSKVSITSDKLLPVVNWFIIFSTASIPYSSSPNAFTNSAANACFV